jgi:Family of unknown function (DUF5684)
VLRNSSDTGVQVAHPERGIMIASINVGALLLAYLVIYILFALGVYGTFEKAGQPGWAAFIPFYNWWIMLKVAGRPTWWFWLIFLGIIPFVGGIAAFIVYVFVANDISKSFGHGGAFTVGLVLLGPIFWYVLWLGPSTYRGPAALAAGGYPQGGYPQGGYAAPPQGGYAPPAQGGYAPPAGQPYPQQPPVQQPPAGQPYPQQPPPQQPPTGQPPQ